MCQVWELAQHRVCYKGEEMGRYLSKAKFHAQQIQHYYDYAGSAGYSQALSHWIDLSSLVGRAMRSKNDKSDAPVIQSIRESVQHMVDEMKKRQTSSDST
jgi:hypothetical protein